MNDDLKTRWISEHSYLWTSGEWGLSHSIHSRKKVICEFSAEGPSLNELISIRAILPRLRDIPMWQVKKEVQGSVEFALGEFGSIEAHRIIETAYKRSLHVRIEDVSSHSYLPVRKDGTAALIIDDDLLAKFLIEEMRRHGVPVISNTEID